MSLNINQLSYLHPDRDMLFQDISFSIEKGEKVSLIGNNGSGKSTLLKILAGKLTTFEGDYHYSEKPYYIPQHFGQLESMTVAQALNIENKRKALHAILDGDATEENFTLLNEDWGIEEKISAAFSKWNISHITPDQPMSELSGGEKTKVFLSGIDIHEPAIILLDEPTNHLDKASREQLYKFIQHSKALMVVVSHDRTLLNLLNKTYELNEKGIDCYGGNYEFFKIQKEEKINALQEQLNEKEKELRKAKKIAREAVERKEKENARGKKRKTKENALPALMDKLQGKAEQSLAKLKDTHTNKIDDIVTNLKDIQQKLPTTKEIKIDLSNSNLHKGKELITAKEINFGYHEKMLWEEPLSFQIRSGDRVVINGKNGTGKTTLIKIITGELTPQKGIMSASDARHMYIDQEYSIIDKNLTLYEQIEKFNSRHFQEHELKTLLHRFLFSSGSWKKKCGNLSGGEKIRLVFCCLQVQNNIPDIIFLDEPTNNLDIQSLEIITSVIKAYEGTVVIISHDEYFINEIGFNMQIQLK